MNIDVLAAVLAGVRSTKKPIVASFPGWVDIDTTGLGLSGGIDPQGLGTGFHVEYGTTPALGNSIPIPDENLSGTGTGIVGVSVKVTGLQVFTRYSWCLVATNAGGTTTSIIREALTAAPKPDLASMGAIEVTDTAATLRGQVNPKGWPLKYWFQSVNPHPTFKTAEHSSESADAFVFGESITNLQPDTEYEAFLIGLRDDGNYYQSNLLIFHTERTPTPGPHGFSEVVFNNAAHTGGSVYLWAVIVSEPNQGWVQLAEIEINKQFTWAPADRKGYLFRAVDSALTNDPTDPKNVIWETTQALYGDPSGPSNLLNVV